MVHNIGPKLLKWSILGGPIVVVSLHMIYDTLIDTSEQLMSQRYQIVPPDVSSSDTLQAYWLLWKRTFTLRTIRLGQRGGVYRLKISRAQGGKNSHFLRLSNWRFQLMLFIFKYVLLSSIFYSLTCNFTLYGVAVTEVCRMTWLFMRDGPSYWYSFTFITCSAATRALPFFEFHLQNDNHSQFVKILYSKRLPY